MSVIVEVNNLSFFYQQQQVLQDVSLQLEEGDFAALIGPNGGGKTTLIKIMLGLLSPDKGNIKIFGHKGNGRKKYMAYVPQFANFRRDFPITVYETVSQGCLGNGGMMGLFSRPDKNAVEQAMQETYTWQFRHRPISDLSGGQLQRVLVARALAGKPKLLLLDEPTANIDERSEKDIFDLFKELNKRMTIIVISHDIAFVSEYVNRVFCLNKTLLKHDSKPVDNGTIQQLYGEHISEVHHSHSHAEHHH